MCRPFMNEPPDIITAIDIGSSKVVCLIAQISEKQSVEIIGIGVTDSTGVRYGIINHIENVINDIKEAVEEAEMMAGVVIDQININLTGPRVYSSNTSGVIAVTNKEKIVTMADIYRVMDAAQSVQMPNDYAMVHVLSKDFKIDDQDGIKDPIGIVGIRLEANIHIVTVHISQIQNLDKVVADAGLMLSNKVLSSVACAHAILSEEERELGVALVDIGQGVVDIIIYVNGGVEYTTTLPIGGGHVTQDISIGLKTPIQSAEKLKKKFGRVIMDEVDPTSVIEVPMVGGQAPKNIFLKELTMIIHARVKEILELVDQELLKSGQKSFLSAGVVFTGGGSLITDLTMLAEEVIGLNAVISYPKNINGITDKLNSPVFTTIFGLIKYAEKYREHTPAHTLKNTIFSRFKHWIANNL